jgi:ribonuclease HI
LSKANIDNILIKVNPTVTAGQLFAFYQRNHICEEGYGRERAARPLLHSSLVIGAFEEEKLVGIARAMFDGLSADIMEFCVELEYQGKNLEYLNGSLIGKDDSGLGNKIGTILIDELTRMGADFITYNVLRDYEETFFKSLGLEPHPNAVVYHIDKRPYRDDERYRTREQMEKLTVNIDGASRGNPGPAAIGVVIKDQRSRVIDSISRKIGSTTNNQAEYQSIIAALKRVKQLGAGHVRVKSDSELLVKQLNGSYRVKNAGLKPLYEEARELINSLESCTIVHIPREENRQADKLANLALDSK